MSRGKGQAAQAVYSMWKHMDSCGGMQTGHSASRLPRPCCSLLLSDSSLLQKGGIIAFLPLRNQKNDTQQTSLRVRARSLMGLRQLPRRRNLPSLSIRILWHTRY